MIVDFSTCKRGTTEIPLELNKIQFKLFLTDGHITTLTLTDSVIPAWVGSGLWVEEAEGILRQPFGGEVYGRMTAIKRLLLSMSSAS